MSHLANGAFCVKSNYLLLSHQQKVVDAARESRKVRQRKERGFDRDHSNVLNDTKDKKGDENVKWQSLRPFPSQLSATLAN